ncbi:MAG: DUF4476 domain-containing protein [Ferruginibacter sp.]
MKGVLLRFCLTCFPVILFSLAARAQNFRFTYIQTEDQKPFYIKMGDHGIFSSASGYIIIPRLTEAMYKIAVGFPQSTLPKYLLTVDLKDTDAGFVIKKNDEQGWNIVDLQTMEPVTVEVQASSEKSEEVIKSNDEFARVLSEVVHDSSIRDIKVFGRQGSGLAKMEANNTRQVSEIVKPGPVFSSKPAMVNEHKSVVSKIGQKNTPEGLQATYLDNGDTVTVFMAVTRVEAVVINEEKPDPPVVTRIETDSLRNIRFIDMELQNPNQQADSGTLKKDEFIVKEKKHTITNSLQIKQQDTVQVNAKCGKTATESDFLQLRKAMASEKTAADMQSIAVTEFGNTCYSTEQVKNLGVLFIADEEKYKFYAAAYPYVTDAENFGKLENQLTDSYYITRFKAILNH